MSSSPASPAATAVVTVPTPDKSEDVRWIKCPRDNALIYSKRLERNLLVCPECSYHFRIGARDRIHFLVDPGTFEELSGDVGPQDPLEFVDSKPYKERVLAAQQKTGEVEGAIYGTATVGGHPLMIVVMDFGFIGGAMGSAVGEIITRAIETATHRQLPLLAVCASGGARMQEGCLSLMQMAKTSAALAVHAEHQLPYLVLLTDPTYGGTTASFASLGDILIAEPDAMIGFAGRSVIETTIRQKLPAEFQRSDFLLEHGMVDMIVPRGEIRGSLTRLLGCFAAITAGRRPTTEELPPCDPCPPPPSGENPPDPWDIVQLARRQDRPNTLEYISGIFNDFQQLHGDRLFGDDAALVGGMARLGGIPCMAIGTLKGRSIKENLERHFGMPHPEGYRKALRLMQQAAKFNMPVVMFVDTAGAYPGIGAEERGQSIAIATNLLAMARLPVPLVTILTGEGGSGGALALGVADRVLMLENAYYSVISPEGCSVILFKNVEAAPRAARTLRITSHELEKLKVIDRIVPEPVGGAHTAPQTMIATLQSAIIEELRQLLTKNTSELLNDRYQRYRRFGALETFVPTNSRQVDHANGR